jgi:hypothetical protein
MADLHSLIDNAIQTLRDGFANINHPQGLLIALVVTVFMKTWKQWIPIALLALIIDRIYAVIQPVIANHGSGQVTLPHNLMEQSYWSQALVLFVGYLIVIGIFFFVKKLIFRGGGGGH